MPHPLVVLVGQAHVAVGELGLIQQLADLLALRADPLSPRDQPRPAGELRPRPPRAARGAGPRSAARAGRRPTGRPSRRGTRGSRRANLQPRGAASGPRSPRRARTRTTVTESADGHSRMRQHRPSAARPTGRRPAVRERATPRAYRGELRGRALSRSGDPVAPEPVARRRRKEGYWRLERALESVDGGAMGNRTHVRAGRTTKTHDCGGATSALSCDPVAKSPKRTKARQIAGAHVRFGRRRPRSRAFWSLRSSSLRRSAGRRRETGLTTSAQRARNAITRLKFVPSIW